MRQSHFLFLLIGTAPSLVSGIIPPIVGGTYVSLKSPYWELDETQSLILIIVFVKIALLTSIASIHNAALYDITFLFDFISSVFGFGRKKRSVTSSNGINQNSVYQTPVFSILPCTIRFICDLKMTPEDRKSYLNQKTMLEYEGVVKEDDKPKQIDYKTYMNIMNVREILRDMSTSKEVNLLIRHALGVGKVLMGSKFCEKAYNQCPGGLDSLFTFKNSDTIKNNI